MEGFMSCLLFVLTNTMYKYRRLWTMEFPLDFVDSKLCSDILYSFAGISAISCNTLLQSFSTPIPKLRCHEHDIGKCHAVTIGIF
jgi:hypothetical protein